MRRPSLAKRVLLKLVPLIVALVNYPIFKKLFEIDHQFILHSPISGTAANTTTDATSLSADASHNQFISHSLINGTSTNTTTNATALTAEHASYNNVTRSNDTLVILVLSARNHFQIRKTIRETWAAGADNVYFLIGQECPYPKNANSLRCDPPARPGSRNQQQQFQNQLKRERKMLEDEMNKNQDIVVCSLPEYYHSLPRKLKDGLDFVVKELQNTEWILKADDDMYVKIDSLRQFLAKQIANKTHPVMIGKIKSNNKVPRKGKWAEFQSYSDLFYPHFGIGSAGYVINRPVAEYVSANRHNLTEYQGEDASMGVWIDDSTKLRRNTEFAHSELFVNQKAHCAQKDKLVVGHMMSPADMQRCYKQLHPQAVKKVS